MSELAIYVLVEVIQGVPSVMQHGYFDDLVERAINTLERFDYYGEGPRDREEDEKEMRDTQKIIIDNEYSMYILFLEVSH